MDKRTKEQNKKLEMWQRRLSMSDRAYAGEVVKMDNREKLYKGSRNIRPIVAGDKQKNGKNLTATHVRNIIFENIESQVSTTIPDPKVTARREKDEPLARLIEHLLRNEKDRLPFEAMNDMAERTVPIQGGNGFLVEWDNQVRTHTTIGELSVSTVHPKQFGPQPGVYTSIDDMDWFIIKCPTTKQKIKRTFGVDVEQETESEPDVRATGAEEASDDTVTLYIGFSKNEKGWIDKYCWVNDIELEDLEDYQARRQPVCSRCGRVRPTIGQVIFNEQPRQKMSDAEQMEQRSAGQAMAEELADQLMGEVESPAVDVLTVEPVTVTEQTYNGGACPWCGCTSFNDQVMEFEQVILPMENRLGVKIPGQSPGVDEYGQAVMRPTQIPFYKPNVYPIVLQRSVSVYGQLLGNSDVDAIADQQNTTNRIERKIIDRIVKAGTRITLPNKANLRTDPEDSERWYLEKPADKQMIDVYDFTGNLQYELTYLAQVYEESRQILGITDSFQGRRDPTATSGKAKEYSAAKAAGRLESKRTMKNAAYADLYERMFKHWLAYSDEPRNITYKDSQGNTVYDKISRYDFLEQDCDGQWYWIDQFLFSCDTSASLAANREAMWQENRMNLQTGAFGDPTSTETLILFWGKMERDHYPGAGETKKYLEEKLQRERQQAMMMQSTQVAGNVPNGMVNNYPPVTG